MEDLIARVASAIGIDEALAGKAVGIVFNLIKSAGADSDVGKLFDAIPGAAEAAEAGGESGGGGLMGAVGGLMGSMGGSLGGAAGAMAAMSKLGDAGLDTDQIQGLGKEVLSFAREKAGDELVGSIVSSIPGLDQFV